MARTRRRIMEVFRINELSAVDRPAQAHAKMTIMKRADPPYRPPAPTTRYEDIAMTTAYDFDALVDHYKDTGMSGTLALKTARSARPDLFAKMQNAPHQRTDDEQAIAKARDGRARQNRVQALVDELARSGMARTEAVREVRKRHPDLF